MSMLAQQRDSGKPSGRFGHVRAGWLLLSAVFFCFRSTDPAHGANFQDMFTNREIFLTAVGSISGNNTTATVEPGEPRHGGKPGGHSLWISWVAPTNGVARLETEGSGFDTLLSVYSFASTNDTTFDKLTEIARADDSEGFDFESEVEFGVISGQRYEIAVDGFYGATGAIELNWRVEGTPEVPPIILSTPPDRTVKLGDPVSLSFVVTNAAGGQFKWLFNGDELGASSTNLFIASMQVSNVGRYKLEVRYGTNNQVSYFSLPVEIQANSESAPNTLAQSKLLDAGSTPLIGAGGGSFRFASSSRLRPLGAGTVVRGYSGSQIFNTLYGTIDTNEPAHCGISNGVSYWLAYQPPTNGSVTLDTGGSSYDTVMEVYTYNGSLAGYDDLISLSCNNDAPGLNTASRLEISVVQTRQYLIVVEGVGGARGTAWLNYNLNTNAQPSPPTLLSSPVPRFAPPGISVSLAADWQGTAPLNFFWRKNGSPMPAATSPVLVLTNVTTSDSAIYALSVSNDLGGFTANLPLQIIIPPRCDLSPISNGLRLSWSSITGQIYGIEEANSLNGPWVSWTNSFPGDGQVDNVDLPLGNTRFFRLRVE